MKKSRGELVFGYDTFGSGTAAGAGAAGAGAAGAAAGAGATGAGAAGAGSGAFGAGVGSGALAGSGAFGAAGASTPASAAVKLANAAMSASSSTTTPIGVPTGTSLAPASIRIFARNPSSCASKSTVALSVSISHTGDPALIASPSLSVHPAIFPVSMVGDKAGIVNIVCSGNELMNRGCITARRAIWPTGRKRVLESILAYC
mmetsp:Transcript_20454/g.33764  ORF Transcript_20454/g.33764 Transcript_20454/m.33764 type:complete len:203 (-) Transcript_20454:95-703(-)